MSLLRRVELAQQAAELAQQRAAEGIAPRPMVPVMIETPTPPAPIAPPPPVVPRRPAAGGLTQRGMARAPVPVPARSCSTTSACGSRPRSSAPSTRSSTASRQTSGPRSRGSSTGRSSSHGFAVTRDERLRLVEEMLDESPASGRSSRCSTTRRSPRSWSTARTTSTSSAPARSSGSTRLPERRARPAGSSTGSSPRSAGASTRSSPRVDARLPDGSRVNAIIAPLSLIGPVITVRKFSHDAVHGRRPDPLRDRDARDVRVPAGLHRGPPQRLRLRRHGLRQDDVPQRPVVVHPERRADRHDRGRRRAPAPPGARDHARGAARRTSRARARSRSATCCATRCTCAPTGSSSASAVSGEALDMLQAMTTGQDGSLSTGHANTPEGHAPAPRDDGPDDRLRAAAARDPRADRVGGRPDRPHRPPQGRLAQGRQHHRGLRDRGRRDPDPGHLRLRADRRRRTARSRASSQPTGIRPTFMAQFAAQRRRAAAGRVRDPARGPGEAGPVRRRAASGSRTPTAIADESVRRRSGLGRAVVGGRHGLRLVDRPDRPRDRARSSGRRSRSTPASA